MANEVIEQVGLLWSWRRSDTLIQLPSPDAAWRVKTYAASHPRAISAICRRLARDFALDELHCRERFALGHCLYLGLVGRRAVAYGWRAVGQAHFGEPIVTFMTPPGSGYLYDFVTLPVWRGRRCYPALLSAILQNETTITSFWIIHQIANIASQRGIARAGFQVACTVYRTADGSFALTPGDDPQRAEAGAALLNLPLLPAR